MRNTLNQESQEAWPKFATDATQNDEVEDFIATHLEKYHNPFFDILFKTPEAGPGIRPSLPLSRRVGKMLKFCLLEYR